MKDMPNTGVHFFPYQKQFMKRIIRCKTASSMFTGRTKEKILNYISSSSDYDSTKTYPSQYDVEAIWNTIDDSWRDKSEF